MTKIVPNCVTSFYGEPLSEKAHVKINLRRLGQFPKHNTFQIVEGFRNLPDSDPTTIFDGTQDPVRKPPLKNKRLD